eukprot:COSAG02_NODE_3304_length_6976_cov_6.587902_1_plen_98_part_00
MEPPLDPLVDTWSSIDWTAACAADPSALQTVTVSWSWRCLDETSETRRSASSAAEPRGITVASLSTAATECMTTARANVVAAIRLRELVWVATMVRY